MTFKNELIFPTSFKEYVSKMLCTFLRMSIFMGDGDGIETNKKHTSLP